MREVIINGKTYMCEMFDTPSVVDGYLRTTVTGPDKPFFRLLKKMEQSGKSKKFELDGLRGRYTGTFAVNGICNKRCIILNVYRFSSEPSSKDNL